MYEQEVDARHDIVQCGIAGIDWSFVSSRLFGAFSIDDAALALLAFRHL